MTSTGAQALGGNRMMERFIAALLLVSLGSGGYVDSACG
jgi:hypothetical protein